MADEKDEKFGEKEHEKQDEKTREKTWEEKWQRDPLGTVVWACIFIWAGIVLLLSNLGYLDTLLKQIVIIEGVGAWVGVLQRSVQAWPLVLAGAGVIILIEVIIRLLVPAYHQPVVGKIILAILLLGIGLGDLINWGIIWAVGLIVLGIWVLLRPRRKE